jgi:hypothetical protein
MDNKTFRINNEINILMHISAHIGTHVKLASSLGLHVGFV